MKKLYSLLLALFAVCGLASAQTVTFTAGTDATADDNGRELTKDGVTIAISDGRLNTPEYRVYKNHEIKVWANGQIIKSVVFTCTASGDAKYGPGSFAATDGYSYEGNVGTWTGTSTLVTLTAEKNQVRASSIVVTLGNDDPNFVAQPVFSPAAGTYYEPQAVSISAADDCVVWYTTDGSAPVDAAGMMTESAQMYEGPITVAETTTITAIAVKTAATAFLASDVVTATYTIEQAASYASIPDMKAAAQTLGQEKQPCQMNTNGLIVIGAKDRNLYVVDYTGEGILLYGTNTMNLVVGDMIGGTIKGKLQLYNGSVELGDMDFSGMTLNQQGVDVQPTAATIADFTGADRLKYESGLVTLSGLTFGATALSSKNIVAKDATQAEITIRDNYGVLADYPFSTSATYDVTGIVAYYNGTVQLYPRTADEIVKVGGGDDPEPQPHQLVGDGSLANPYTVEDINSMTIPDGGNANGENKVWVKAQIIGFANGAFNENKVVFGSSEAIASNIVIIDEANNSVVAAPELKYCAPVALPNGTNAEKAIRAALNLADNPNLVGQTVWLYGDITKYFGVNGVKNLKQYSLDGQTILPADDEPEPEPQTGTVCYTIAELKEIAANKPTVEYIFRSALVQYVDNNNVYLYDGTNGLQLYKQQGGTFTVGAVVCGTIKGKIQIYNGGVEFNAPTCEGIVEIQGVDIDGAPQEVQVGTLTQAFNDYSNELVIVKDLTFETSALESKNIVARDVTGAPITIRDNFGVLSDYTFGTNAIYDITGFAASNTKDGETTIQIFPRSTDDVVLTSGEEPEPQPTIDWTSSADEPLTVAATLEKAAGLEPGATGSEFYVKGFVTSIVEISPQFGNATYYIADNVAGDATQLYVFRGNSLDGAYFSSDSELIVGDEVVLVGKMQNYLNKTTQETTLELINSKIVKRTTSGEPTPVEITTYASVPEMRKAAHELGTNKQKCQMNTNGLTVIAVKGKNVWVVDYTNEGGIMLYGNNTLNLEVGQTIGGTIKGTLQLYNGTAELGDVDYSEAGIIDLAVTVEPVEATIADLTTNVTKYESGLVVLRGLNFGEAAVFEQNTMAYDESDNEIVIRDNFATYTGQPISVGADYDVTAIVAIYNDAPQLYPRTINDIVKAGEAELQAPESAWSQTSAITAVGETLDITFTTTSDGAVTYTSSNPDVATVDDKGVITAVSAGEVAIIATTAATDTYRESTAKVNVVVAEQEVTVSEAIEQWDGTTKIEDTVVRGFIVGYVNGNSIKTGAVFFNQQAENSKRQAPRRADESTEVSVSNLLIADNKNELDVDKCIPVQLPVGEVRSGLNLRDNSNLAFAEVELYGDIDKYFGVCGLKSVSAYNIVSTEDAVKAVRTDIAGDDVIYAIDGRRIKTITRPGLYVIGGRKVVVK